MAKQWYIVHTHTGFEDKVKEALLERIRSAGQQDLFGDILVPTEQVVEMVKGSRKTSSRKFFPGYILINMELNDSTWHTVHDTPRITGFVGDNLNPQPLPEIDARGWRRSLGRASSTGPRERLTRWSGATFRISSCTSITSHVACGSRRSMP